MLNTDKSIVVLPFTSFSPEKDNEFLADGITEEITTALAKVKGLKVIARTSAFSFKGKNIDIREIGKMLDVRLVLEGSFRKAGDKVRITAQLIDSDDGAHLWAENFDRQLTDIFELQDEVSLLIADQIRENFGHIDIQEHLVDKQTSDITAYELFLKARLMQLRWTPDSLKEAVKLYEESIAHDNKFVRSYYGLLQSYGLLAAWGFMPQEEGFKKGIEYFIIARDLDNTLPEYFMAFVGKSFWKDWDYNLTFERLKQTLEVDPVHNDALEAMGELFLANGYFDEAETYILKAIETDPMSSNHHYTLANISYYKKDYLSALNHIRFSLNINEELKVASELKILCCIMLNDKPEFDKAVVKSAFPELAEILFKVINQKYAPDSKTVEELTPDDEGAGKLIPYDLYILANSCNHSEAISKLSVMVKQKRGQIINFRVDPLLESIRYTSEFKELLPARLEYSPVEAEVTNESSKLLSDSDSKIIQEKLNDFIVSEQGYLNNELTLRKLAKIISVHPNKLSQFINDIYSQNFNEYINTYRLNYFKSIAFSDEFNQLNIMGKAYQAGFNSKTVFNTFFKKKEGVSPKEWIKNSEKSSES